MTTNVATIQKPKKSTADRFVSLEKYFQNEEKALFKSEYHHGKVIKMAGGTYNHDSLAVMFATLLNIFVLQEDLDYSVNGSDLKIRIEKFDKVVYSDALVITEKVAFYNDRKDTITNPVLIVEVLSNSTQKFDRTSKFEYYRSIESLKEYVLVHQDRKCVHVYTKQTDATWLLRDYDGDEAVAILYAVHNCPIPLKTLYRGLEL
jgi:Uma2 family endonuclease